MWKQKPLQLSAPETVEVTVILFSEISKQILHRFFCSSLKFQQHWLMEVNLLRRMIFCSMLICLFHTYQILIFLNNKKKIFCCRVIYCFVFVLEFLILYLLKVSKFASVIPGPEPASDNSFVSVTSVSWLVQLTLINSDTSNHCISKLLA